MAATSLGVASPAAEAPSEDCGRSMGVGGISEGIHRVGLAAAVANANANAKASTNANASGAARATPGPARGASPSSGMGSSAPQRLPPPPTTTAGLPRSHPYSGSAYGGLARGSGIPGRGGSSGDIRSRLLSRLGIYGSSPPAGDAGGKAAQMQFQKQPLTAAQHRRVRILRGMGVGHNVFYQSPPDGSATRRPLSGVVPSKEPLKTGIYSDDEIDDDSDCDDESIVVPDDSDCDEEHDLQHEEGDNGSRTGVSRRRSSAGSTSGKTKTKMRRSSSTSKLLRTKPTRIAFQDQVEVVPIPTRHEYSDRIKSRIWSNRYELQENAERNAVEFASEGWNWRNVTEDEGMYICSVSGELVHPAWVGGLPTVDNNNSDNNTPGSVGTQSQQTNTPAPPAPGGENLAAPGAPAGGN
ncbi:unnamed protein product [Pseudo-nitzschia multistriata]|uniref:Uncharacterized protein n=1 Tax=Pseudo-nitzschia multistriata TaxID=183589 RepID=A0A448ZHD6_9STRA|nr:unnamed protein product [Pseudo-nitzschia multistriata]